MDVSLRCELVDGEIDRNVAAEVLSLVLFEHGATAVGEEKSGESTSVLIGGFATESAARAALALLIQRYEAWIGETTIVPGSNDWATTQREGLEPTQIGPWYVRAPWNPERSDIEPRYDVVIDPGVAFGHGAHPSTVMAIELMLRSSRRGGHLLDVGTGTAIIAIIAARLGLSVTAVESDAASAEIAWFNIERNAAFPHDEVSELIDLQRIDANDLAAPDGETLVVANVTLDVQRKIAGILSSASTVILSGILCSQVAKAVQLYPEHDGHTIRTHGEWASIELRRHKRLTSREKR